MNGYDKAVDVFIAKKADFAKPILEHFRELVHNTCPEVQEKIKWGMPFFDYKNEMMCHMAAFKNHAVIGFWKASLMKDAVLMQNAQSEVSMGHLGKITSLKDMPFDKKLSAYIKEAMKLNDDGIKLIKKPVSTEKKEIFIPDYFLRRFPKIKKLKKYSKTSHTHTEKNMCNG